MKYVLFCALVSIAMSVSANEGHSEKSARSGSSPEMYENQAQKSQGNRKKGKKQNRPDLERGVNTGTPEQGSGMPNNMDKNLKPENE
ncbi:hypothetical protein B9G69_012475 [Bdellovibrio sp. SKB1291214]|uniref:hypothetical protein n=1 Tax=Bdellovibrio sp. SKB1291214 TaxID=1732569 RepID=UPI000B515822|nr:hypothetical protein [Bdellovibrio sp. SKB1291214]UYL07861.1 hypothetical protein B9G69_012475 [Bdellovibrio sp. SKB1291214]